MSANTRNRTLIPMLLLTGLFTLPATAEITVHQVGVEADQINVDISAGHVRVQGCRQCPLELSIDANTMFYSHGKTINHEQIQDNSGQAGSVTYDKDSKRTIKINW